MDIQTDITADLRCDWLLSGPDLATDDGLRTAVIISLFSDRRADAADDAPAEDRRGWWADAWPQVPGDLLGSRLWLLSREKQTSDALTRAREYAEEALLWFIDDGICRSVTVTAEIVRTSVMGLTITLTRSAAPPVKFRFETFWKGV